MNDFVVVQNTLTNQKRNIKLRNKVVKTKGEVFIEHHVIIGRVNRTQKKKEKKEDFFSL